MLGNVYMPVGCKSQQKSRFAGKQHRSKSTVCILFCAPHLYIRAIMLETEDTARHLTSILAILHASWVQEPTKNHGLQAIKESSTEAKVQRCICFVLPICTFEQSGWKQKALADTLQAYKQIKMPVGYKSQQKRRKSRKGY